MSDLKTYRAMLRLNKHRLDDDLEIQPELQERISARVAALGAEAQRTADELRGLEARLFMVAKEGGASDKVADQAVRGDRGRLASWQAWQRAKADHEEWQGLYEAWKSRGYSIKDLVSLYAAAYFVVDGHHSTGRRPATRVDYSEQRGANTRPDTTMPPGHQAPVAARRRAVPP